MKCGMAALHLSKFRTQAAHQAHIGQLKWILQHQHLIQAVEVEVSTSYKTDNMIVRAKEKYGFGWVDWRGVFGQPENNDIWPRLEDLKPMFKHEVFNTPLETLHALWLARFGSRRVIFEEIEDEDFWRLAAVRLNEARILYREHNTSTSDIGLFLDNEWKS